MTRLVSAAWHLSAQNQTQIYEPRSQLLFTSENSSGRTHRLNRMQTRQIYKVETPFSTEYVDNTNQPPPTKKTEVNILFIFINFTCTHY